ncbi:MAG: hypothetical protein ACYC0M_15450 [Burkholderiales bacterium]
MNLAAELEVQRDKMLAVLKDVLEEAAGNSKPYSTDSYLPAFLICRLRGIIDEVESEGKK